jgi:hypothetical protein
MQHPPHRPTPFAGLRDRSRRRELLAIRDAAHQGHRAAERLANQARHWWQLLEREIAPELRVYHCGTRITRQLHD